jgi:hypothetical protein
MIETDLGFPVRWTDRNGRGWNGGAGGVSEADAVVCNFDVSDSERRKFGNIGNLPSDTT